MENSKIADLLKSGKTYHQDLFPYLMLMLDDVNGNVGVSETVSPKCDASMENLIMTKLSPSPPPPPLSSIADFLTFVVNGISAKVHTENPKDPKTGVIEFVDSKLNGELKVTYTLTTGATWPTYEMLHSQTIKQDAKMELLAADGVTTKLYYIALTESKPK